MEKPDRSVLECLYREHGSVARVARALGVNRRQVSQWMKDYEIEFSNWGKPKKGRE